MSQPAVTLPGEQPNAQPHKQEVKTFRKKINQALQYNEHLIALYLAEHQKLAEYKYANEKERQKIDKMAGHLWKQFKPHEKKEVERRMLEKERAQRAALEKPPSGDNPFSDLPQSDKGDSDVAALAKAAAPKKKG